MTALPDIPLVQPGMDLASVIHDGLRAADVALRDGDTIVVASKLVSRAEGRFVALENVVPSDGANDLAERVDQDPRIVELVLRESISVSRSARGALIVRNRLGMVQANAGIDLSNACDGPMRGDDGGPSELTWVLLLPSDPDKAAGALREGIRRRTGVSAGVIISDSHGRPFRLGSVGVAIGLAGMPALLDYRGEKDLLGRALMHTQVAVADQLAAAAELVMGQGDEGQPVVHVRGLTFTALPESAATLIRPPAGDLYA